MRDFTALLPKSGADDLHRDASPGTLFTARQISNQYLSTDAATRSVVSYGIDELRVRHVILMGHIGASLFPSVHAPRD